MKPVAEEPSRSDADEAADEAADEDVAEAADEAADGAAAEPDALSEAPTVEACDTSDDDDASSSTSAAPSDDKLITAPVAATGSLNDGGGFARILGNVAPLVEKMNESGKREEELAAKTDDLKDRMRRLNLTF
jgi:hypothetical protein